MFHHEPTPRRPGLVAGCLLVLLLSTTLAPAAPPVARPEPAPEPLLPASLDDSRVILSYADLRHLIARASPPVPSPLPPGPPLSACLLEARYHLRFENDQPHLEATLTVENLSPTWSALPLGGIGAATLASPLPAGLRLARENERLLLLLETPGRAVCHLRLLPAVDGTYTWSVPAEAALAALELAAPPPALAMEVTGPEGLSTRSVQPLLLGLEPGQGPLRLALTDRATHPTDPAPSLDAAIVSTAGFQSQIARDGAQLTHAVLRIEHRTATRLRLALPAQAELLRGTVAGRPLPAAVTLPDGTLDLPLPPLDSAAAEATEVTLTYFLQSQPLHASEGEFDLALPRTPLLIQRLDWSIELPEGLEISAQGNAEPVPAAAPSRHLLQLTRRLCRDSATQVRLTYRHPQPTTRP